MIQSEGLKRHPNDQVFVLVQEVSPASNFFSGTLDMPGWKTIQSKYE